MILVHSEGLFGRLVGTQNCEINDHKDLVCCKIITLLCKSKCIRCQSRLTYCSSILDISSLYVFDQIWLNIVRVDLSDHNEIILC